MVWRPAALPRARLGAALADMLQLQPRLSADANATSESRRFVIIGGGASGVAAFVAAVRARAAESITIVDPLGIGRGVAFATRHPALLCNTSVETMSILDDDPNDFFAYLRESGRAALHDAFVARAMVSDYLVARHAQWALRAQVVGIAHCLHVASARRVEKSAPGYRVWLDDGAALDATDVLVCTGNGAPYVPDLVRPHVGAPMLFESPYPEQRVLAALAPDSRVLVLGSRLSAVDSVLLLGCAGHTIAMASPSGRLPSVRTGTPLVCPVPVDANAFARLNLSSPRLASQLLWIIARATQAVSGRPLRYQIDRHPDPIERLRREVALAQRGDTDWQHILVAHMDAAALRLRDAPVSQQREALAACSRAVGRYLFACPVESAASLLERADAGRLTVKAAAPVSLWYEASWHVGWEDGSHETYDAVVCATGFQKPPLYATANALFLHGAPRQGVPPDVSADGQVRLDGAARSERIWTLGIASHLGAPITNAVYQAVRQAGQLRRSWQTAGQMQTERYRVMGQAG